MRGKRLTVEQCKQLEACGIKGDPRKKFLAEKNTPTMLQLKDIRTGDSVKFRKIKEQRRVTLELMYE